MSATLKWLQARADNVAVGLLAAMFLAFVLQVVARYVLNYPIGWTLELCLTTWLWLVFWEGAFLLRDRDHVKFDMFYLAAGKRLRRTLAIVGALGILVGLLAAMPATYDYITFYKIKKSATLHIRLDYVFSIYGIFVVAVVLRYAVRLWHLVRGADLEELDGESEQ
jgi:C4-dicarboxylate transporter, DctQ subunit